MCMRSEYDLYARMSSKPVRSKPARSLVEVLRDLFRPQRPQVEQAEVIPLLAGTQARSDQKVDREGSKAAELPLANRTCVGRAAGQVS